MYGMVNMAFHVIDVKAATVCRTVLDVPATYHPNHIVLEIAKLGLFEEDHIRKPGLSRGASGSGGRTPHGTDTGEETFKCIACKS